MALLTPYPRAVHEAIAAFLDARGISVADQTCLGIDSGSAISRVTAAQLRDAVVRLRLAGADAIFLSCIALRTAGLIDALEAERGLPVVTSNQALAWHCLHQTGRAGGLGRGGQLLKE